jgi:hypothetical protein
MVKKIELTQRKRSEMQLESWGISEHLDLII